MRLIRESKEAGINLIGKTMDQEVIYKALRGKATPDELEQVARWHSENPEEFQRYADEVHMQIDMMELYGEEIRPASWIAAHWRKVVIITVQAAAILAIGLFVGGYISKKHTYDMFAGQINILQVPYGQRLKFTLPDGSSVQLNSGAKIEYPSVFKKNLRKVKLSGEAMLEVKHDKNRPFIVETFASDIRVLGTKFNVMADESHRHFSVALLRGRLQISNRLNPMQKDIILKPNDIANFSDGRLFIEPITDPEMLCWTEGLVSISGLPFDELMEKFERVFDVKIDITLATLPDIGDVSGKIRVNDGIDKALHLLQYAADFSFRKDSETNIVTIY